MTARAKRFLLSFLSGDDCPWTQRRKVRKKTTKYLRIGSRGKLGAKKKQRSFTGYLFTMGVFWTVIYSLEIRNRYRENWEIVNFMWELFAGISFVLNGIFSYHKSHKFSQIPKIRSPCNHFGLVICHINFHNVLSFFSPHSSPSLPAFPTAFLSTYQRIAFPESLGYCGLGILMPSGNSLPNQTANQNIKELCFSFFLQRYDAMASLKEPNCAPTELRVQKEMK